MENIWLGIAWEPRDVSLKMRFYQVLPFLRCVVATQLACRAIDSVSRLVLIGSKSGTATRTLTEWSTTLLDLHSFSFLLSQDNIY
jgi:hypothetical protein